MLQIEIVFIFFASGQHVTLVAHSKAVGTCLEAAKLLAAAGIDSEVGLK